MPNEIPIGVVSFILAVMIAMLVTCWTVVDYKSIKFEDLADHVKNNGLIYPAIGIYIYCGLIHFT